MPTLTTDRFGRTRDTQRQRVYDAENAIRGRWSPAGRRLLDREARLIPYSGYGVAVIYRDGKPLNPSIEDAARYVEHVLQAAWFQRRWGRQTLTVNWKANGSATCSFYGGSLSLPPWSRCEAVILHEIAHHLVAVGPDRKVACHGPEFAGVFLSLVRHFLGAEAGRVLRESLRTHRARVSMRLVPAPSRPVVTAEDRKAKAERVESRLLLGSRRLAAAQTVATLAGRSVRPLWGAPGTKARRHAQDVARTLRGAGQAWTPGHGRPVTLEDVEAAGPVLRAAIKAGVFGPAGCKPRARAGAVARDLAAWEKSMRPVGARQMVYAARVSG